MPAQASVSCGFLRKSGADFLAVAQLLITNDNMVHETRHQNFTNTLNRLLELGALPIINENDTVATEEIVIGDNDTLAAKVAKAVHADLLILLAVMTWVRCTTIW